MPASAASATASARVRQLIGYQQLRSSNLETAVQAVKRYRLDPLQVRGANPALVDAAHVLEALYQARPAADQPQT